MKEIKSIGFIMDGNRRWATSQNKSKLEGHRYGLDKVLEVISWAEEEKIKSLTFYAFSTENWKRSPIEIKTLMSLFEELLTEIFEKLKDKKIELDFIGNFKKLPKKIQRLIEKSRKEKVKKARVKVNIAISYGGRDEIVRAVNKIIKEERRKKVNEKSFEKYLDSANIPEPEIIIRTGGACRLSNFLLWKSAYSELFFIKSHWPAFSKKEFKKILKIYREKTQINKGV